MKCRLQEQPLDSRLSHEHSNPGPPLPGTSRRVFPVVRRVVEEGVVTEEVPYLFEDCLRTLCRNIRHHPSMYVGL